jgi:hypothetical protein
MTGRELFVQWGGRDDLWPTQTPAGQRAWDRLAAWIERRQAEAIAEVVARREGLL